ncbi:hypothetical protein ABBQ32_009480 [Trebouxia sp. C0010 RCD-2024]
MSFVLCEDGADTQHKVLLGSQPTCSCRKGKGIELCIHHVFVMLRILRLSASNPLIWQLSLIDRELDEALWQSGTHQIIAAQQGRENTMLGAAAAAAPVKRRPVEQEDACSICYGDMREGGFRAAPELVWCRTGCGHNVHARCLHIWAKHQATLKQEVTCPMCRSAWGPFSWRPPPALHCPNTHQKAHTGSHCKGCNQAPITGRLYACLACARLQLCSPCFQGGKHPQHSFACCPTPGAPHQPAHRDMQAALLTSLTFCGAALPSPTRSAELKQPTDSGSSKTALCKAGGSNRTDGVRSHHRAVPQSSTRQLAGNAGGDASGVPSSHADSSPPSNPNQPLPVGSDRIPVMQTLQPIASRAEIKPAHDLNGQKALSDRQAVRKAGPQDPAGSTTRNAAGMHGSLCPSLQGIVGIAMGCNTSQEGEPAEHVKCDAQSVGRRKMSTRRRPKVRASATQGVCSAVQRLDQDLQCIAQGFQGMHTQDISTISRHHVAIDMAGTDMQLLSVQHTRRQAGKVRCSVVRKASTGRAACCDGSEAQPTPALEAAGMSCSHLQ